MFCSLHSGHTHENLYSSKNNHYRKKSAALPAAALPFARGTSRFALVASAAADRDWNRTAQNFFEILLAIPYSTALQKMSIFENAVLVCESAHVYTQVCLANLQLNGTRYFSAPFKLGLSGSAAVPLPRVPPFYQYASFLSIHFRCACSVIAPASHSMVY